MSKQSIHELSKKKESISNNNIDKSINEIIKKKDDKQKIIKDILILSGGGIKVFAHIGALQALEEYNILKNIKTYAGTSAGGFIAFLLCLNYTIKDITTIMTGVDLNKLKSLDLTRLISNFGLDDGKNIMFVLKTILKNKDMSEDITFKKLYDITKKELILTGVCVHTSNVHYFSYTHTPDMPVITAVRITISVPIYFTPVLYENKLFVDGGLMDNLPINLFKDKLESVIGLYLVNCNEYKDKPKCLEDYLVNIYNCQSKSIIKNTLDGLEKYVVSLNLPDTVSIDLSIDNSTKNILYKCGYTQTINFITKKLIN